MRFKGFAYCALSRCLTDFLVAPLGGASALRPPIADLWRRKDADARGDSRRGYHHQPGREESSTGEGNGKRGRGDLRPEMRDVPRSRTVRAALLRC